MSSLFSSSGSSRSLFSKSNTYEEPEVLKEYNIKEYSASEFEFVVLDAFSSPLSGLRKRYFSDKKFALQDFTIGELEHYKEARGHSKWEHEFLVAKMYLPNSSEVAGVLLIDREQRPDSPDIVRVVPKNTYSSLALMPILAHLGYHPSNLGRTCVFASPPSVGEIASVLAEKSRMGGEYTVHNHNCYWYAAQVFDHCLHTYGGSTTNGPYADDLGTIMKDTPKAFVAEVRLGTVVRTTGVVASIFLGGLTASSLLLGVYVVAISTYAGILKKGKLFQAEPLWS